MGGGTRKNGDHKLGGEALGSLWIKSQGVRLARPEPRDTVQVVRGARLKGHSARDSPAGGSEQSLQQESW